MSKCQGEGATHHTGCECHEAKWAKLVETLQQSLDDAHESNVRWAATVGTLAKERAELRDRIGVLADRLENGASELRDAWKAEDWVRSVLRRLWDEVLGKAPVSEKVCEAVEAALEEGDQL